MPNHRKPIPIKLVLGSGLLLVSVFLVGSTFSRLMSGEAHDDLFAAPGTHQVEISDPGRYYLWHHYKTLFQGETIRRNRKLPANVQFSIQDKQGQELELIFASDKAWSIGNHAKASIAYVELQENEVVEISVEHSDNAVAVLSFSKADMKKDLWSAFGNLPIALGTAVLGLPLVLWTLFSRRKS